MIQVMHVMISVFVCYAKSRGMQHCVAHHSVLEWRAHWCQHQQHLLEINWEFPHRFKSCSPRLRKFYHDITFRGR
jgi:hypothetical protein